MLEFRNVWSASCTSGKYTGNAKVGPKTDEMEPAKHMIQIASGGGGIDPEYMVLLLQQSQVY